MAVGFNGGRTKHGGAKAIGFILAVALLLSACTVVVDPVGETPEMLPPQAWNGVWLADSHIRDSYRAEVIDAASGRLRLQPLHDAGVTGDGVEEVLLRSGGGGLFASIRRPEGYIWFRVDRCGDVVTVRAPATDEFRAKVERGELPGWLDGSTVYLRPLSGETLRLLASPDGVPLFEPEVLVLRRQPSPPSESGAGKSP